MKRLTLYVALSLVCSGCALFRSEKLVGAKAARNQNVVVWHPDGRIEMKRTVSESKGTSYEGKNVKDISGGAVTASQDSAKAGGVTYEAFKPFTNIKSLYVFGGVMIAGGIVVGYFSTWMLGILLAASGVLVIAAATLFETYPWIGIIPVFGFLVAGGYMLYTLYRGKMAGKVNEAVVPSIETLPPHQSDVVKKEIKDRSGLPNSKEQEQVKNEVRRIKRKLGIG